MSELTPKQQRFVEEYLVDLNATQAAIRAGYSAKTAQEQSARLFSNVMVQQAIQTQRTKVAERTMRTVADVMADIGRVRANAMQPVVDPETGIEGMLSHKEALKALELEGKHLGAFTERIEHSGPGGSAIPTIINLVAPNG